MTGKLIVFEGIDGSGKTTQSRLLASWLRQKGKAVTEISEPTIRPCDCMLRSLRGRAVIDWFIADRRENVRLNIRPALERGDIVIMDRYYFSTIAYQGVMTRNPNLIREMNEAFAPIPDLLFLLDITPEVAMERVGKRGAPDAFERLDYLKEVAGAYARMWFSYMRRLDGTAAKYLIHWQVVARVDELLRG